jgi:hypothetical protein
MSEAITWKRSADIGITRSRSVFEGAMESSAMDLAIGPLILADAQAGEFAQLLDAGAGVPQRFHRCPVPEGGLLLGGDVDHLATVVVP